MGSAVLEGNTALDDGDVERPLLSHSPHTFTIENRWSIFPPPGLCHLVIPYRHVEGLEDLTSEELEDLLVELEQHLTRCEEGKPSGTFFVNVGADAGGSIAHLHGQVVVPPQPVGVKIETQQIDEDWKLALNFGLTIAKEQTTLSWVPAAPEYLGEIRFLVAGATELSGALVPTLPHLAGFPYNLLARHIENTSELFVQLVPRIDRGISYQSLFGVTPVGLDLPSWANLLRGDK